MKGSATCRAALAAVLYGILVKPAFAEDQPLYEDLADVSIGDVFFSAAERARLDRQRRPRLSTGDRLPDGDARQSRTNKGMGVFSRSGGRSKVYKDGDFVIADSATDITFPGEVSVTRTRTSETDDSVEDGTKGGDDETGQD